jgi:hypothetical protein
MDTKQLFYSEMWEYLGAWSFSFEGAVLVRDKCLTDSITSPSAQVNKTSSDLWRTYANDIQAGAWQDTALAWIYLMSSAMVIELLLFAADNQASHVQKLRHIQDDLITPMAS